MPGKLDALLRRSALNRVRAKQGRAPLYQTRTAAYKLPTVNKKLYNKRRAATARKYYPKTQVVEATGGSITKSFSLLAHRPSKQVVALKRIGAPNHYTTNSADVQGVASGFQHSWAYPWLDNAALNSIRNVIGGGGALGSYRFVIESLVVETLITSMVNVPVELEMWDLVLKKDLQTTLVYQGPSASTYDIGPIPSAYWDQGSLVDANLPTATNPPNSQFLGSSPYDVQLFRDYFKQVKKTVVMLPQGASHRHQVVRKTNRVIDDAFIRQTGIAGHKGLTSYTMFNIKGFPVATVTNPEPIPPSVSATASSAAVSLVTTYRYKYTWCQDISNFNTNIDNLTSPADGNQNIINIGSGQADYVKNTVPT